MIIRVLMLVTALVLLCSLPATALILNLGEEEIIEAGGLPISVDSYSVPSLVDWNDDGLPDLLVGEGGGLFQGRVRVYLNDGAPSVPAFTHYSYVLADGQELVVPGNG